MAKGSIVYSPISLNPVAQSGTGSSLPVGEVVASGPVESLSSEISQSPIHPRPLFPTPPNTAKAKKDKSKRKFRRISTDAAFRTLSRALSIDSIRESYDVAYNSALVNLKSVLKKACSSKEPIWTSITLAQSFSRITSDRIRNLKRSIDVIQPSPGKYSDVCMEKISVPKAHFKL